MKTYVNSFIHGRDLCKKSMLSAAACCVLSVLGQWISPAVQVLFGGATIILFITTIVIIVRQCRCPHCGKIIFLGVLAVTACPNCKRSLTTGKKVKKSK